ncbi:helix-turn-helix domain-containing GNAT family N-acetyltransferase [Stigmatella sp. ncwal1]|uniref:Helix-turn-helix domain-containing GNAT family N-acetyltransferase n=1 Tax=Stigmatella ashevillensis TaxID=2995309 RepID=A0ABT5DK76_9BACT|nr:helix-turn-helix domain-containing GNAT family N-acetyltransferase [Stigmatella ashevillena]MDC0713989.1 helix-turn-helix domain-containing GNAT family N-acetyltransferase [Stigmatella ashevillena]
MTSHTAILRRFNRTYTQRIGALEESFLGLGWPLGASRLVFEIGSSTGGGPTVRDLRERLGLDSGYLSRLLRRLEDAGVVKVLPDPGDRRRRVATLTARGRRVWQKLEERSESLAQGLIAPLTGRQRERLAEALATADLLVRAATVHLREVGPGDPLAIEAVGRYFAELNARFPGGFDPGDAATTDAASMGAGAGVFVVATSDGQPVACGGVQQIGDGIGEIKRMWVHPEWRGAGLGSRMLRHLEDEAARLGHTRICLDTHDTLTEAIAMYERAGYLPVERYNDNPYARRWFAKDLPGA